jgi:hypothetical protein
MSENFFLEHTRDIPRDVTKFSVFPGSGVFSWLKMVECQGLNMRVFGFDIFNSDLFFSGIKTKEGNVMSSLFRERGFSPLGYE